MRAHMPWPIIAGLALVLVACQLLVPPTPAPEGSIGEQQALDAAWNALEPNTSSHDRANWEVVEVRQVTGQEVVQEFAGEPAPGCWKGPTPPANETIDPSGTYWYVEMKPRPATPIPQKRTVSPTEPPFIPEPFTRGAQFLIDVANGQVVARKLHCVIY
jgi:hypothetical protein